MGFSVSNGQIIGPNGQPFIARGIAVLDSEMSATSPASIISQFPGINSVNLAVGADGNGYATAQSNAAITAWVNQATALGLVVTLSDYVPGQPQARTGADLQASLNWYAQLASAFANNPNVWWTTENEVGGNQAQEDQGIYNAIRGAGNNSLIFMEAQDGAFTNGLDPSIYANMTNVGWNIHVYPWEFDTSQTSQTYYDNTVKGFVSTFQNFAHSQDGVMPVLMGEGGNSTGGNGVAPDDPIVNGNFAVTKAITDTAGVSGGTAGYLMWLHDWHGQVSPGGGNADTLVLNNTLTDFGAQVAAAISSSNPTPPPPAPLLPPSPNATKITTASGTPVVDAAGRSWTLVQSATQGLQIAINGTVDTSTANVVLLETLNGNMVQENSAGNWYSEPGTGGAWTQIAAPVAAPTPSADGTKITTASGTPVVDAAGRSWTLVQSATQGLQLAINGMVDTSTANVVLLETLNGNMVQENSAGSWYSEPGTGGVWTQIAAPVAPPAPSADGTKITAASGNPIIDKSGNAWTLVQSATNGLQIAVNGTVDIPTANVVLLETLNGAMVQENAAGNWYSETTPNDSWTQIANPNPTTPPTATATVTGSGSDTLVLSISEDAYANGDGTSDANGDAAFAVSVDGKQLAGTFYATASHSAGASQNLTLKGDWAPGAHTVTVAFLNDAWGGTTNTDRNLYVNDVTYDGTDTKQGATLMSTGSQSFSVTDSTAIPPVVTGGGSDSLVVKVSEDYYLANAQFTVSIDGKQLGGTFTATTPHSSANSQTFAFAGDFGSGQHTVSVNFLNDAWAGTPATDRNLYVNDIIYNGTDTGQAGALMSQGAKTFSVSGGTTPSVSETGDHGSLQKNLSQTGSYSIGGDTFVLGSGNAGTVTLGTGTSQIKFVGPSSVTLTGGSGQATVTANAGNNKFVAGTGSLDVTGGAGKDAYVFHTTSGLLTLEDFSLAKGDTLTIDKSLQGSLHEASDAKGGTMLTFGTNTSHGVDIRGLAALPSSNIVWA